jgi:hypothetical protein
MIPRRRPLLGDDADIVGFAGRVGAFLLADLIDCLGDSAHLAGILSRALKAGLLSLELDEKLVVATEAGLQAAGLSDLGPCRLRPYNVLETIEGARMTMKLERLGYAVYGPREQQGLRIAGHELPRPVLQESRTMKHTCDPGHLLWVNQDSRTRPISLQPVLLREGPSLRLKESTQARLRCDQLAGVIHYVPPAVAVDLYRRRAGDGLSGGTPLVFGFRTAMHEVMSERRFVIVGEILPAHPRDAEVSRVEHDFTRHDTTTISYHAAVKAIYDALPEVHLMLYPDRILELIERVFAVPLAGRPAPSRDSDAQVSFRATVWALAEELRWHRADTCGASYEHTAERILELPLQESLEEQPLRFS